VAAYARGGGYVEPFAIWWPSLIGDAEYDPALCFVAADEAGEIVGVAQCWTSAFVKDLAVAPTARRQGLGAALLCQAFHVFRERGAAHLDLKVEADNPTGALRLYRALGFREIESYRLA
jgi:ribosomal protein S18 acetylase RimI-like enzyme